MGAVDHMRVAADNNKEKRMVIDSSDYEDDEDGQYEEVGYDDFDEDEDEVIVPPQQQQKVVTPGMHYSNGTNKRSGSIVMSTPLNELKENDDEEYSEAADEESIDKEKTQGI